MLEFAQTIPVSAGLEWVKDYKFLFYFEAERLLTMRALLLESGLCPEDEIQILDFGFLHGIVPEFLHRFFPRAIFTVLDHPDSPNFRNSEYLARVAQRPYLRLEPCNIADVANRPERYDVIVLGEIIEHLDPTTVAKAIDDLHRLVVPEGRLLITTPNGAGLKNCFYAVFGEDALHPPIPDGTMNYGHIHLWTLRVLKVTMEHFGWRHDRTTFNHGFDRWHAMNTNQHWGSLRHQLVIRALYLGAKLYPAWRGFFVSIWRPEAAHKAS